MFGASGFSHAASFKHTHCGMMLCLWRLCSLGIQTERRRKERMGRFVALRKTRTTRTTVSENNTACTGLQLADLAIKITINYERRKCKLNFIFCSTCCNHEYNTLGHTYIHTCGHTSFGRLQVQHLGTEPTLTALTYVKKYVSRRMTGHSSAQYQCIKDEKLHFEQWCFLRLW